MQIFWTKIEDIVDEQENIFTYILKVPEDFTWEEGAHTHFALNGFNDGEKPDKGLVRHMSIATTVEEAKIGITTRISQDTPSRFKTVLKEQFIGSPVALFKTGARILLRRENRPIVLLSQGISQAALRPLLINYKKDPSNIDGLHFLSVTSDGSNLFGSLFDTDESINFYSTTVNNRFDYYSNVEQFTEIENAYYYVVGDDTFIADTARKLIDKNIGAEQIILDRGSKQLATLLDISPE